MSYAYLVLPFFTWLITGTLKFMVNFAKEKRAAFGAIGYGGFPSNHSAICTSMAVYIGLDRGVQDPALGVAVALLFIVVLDAVDLRGKVGHHARAINELSEGLGRAHRLRERVGHSWFEVAGGVLVGGGVALACHSVAG